MYVKHAPATQQHVMKTALYHARQIIILLAKDALSAQIMLHVMTMEPGYATMDFTNPMVVAKRAPQIMKAVRTKDLHARRDISAMVPPVQRVKPLLKMP
jgi:hypothetical protein